jgi:acylpyruvate hydrolase
MKLITLQLPAATGAAVVTGDGTARVFGTAAAPTFPDVGAILRAGLLADGPGLEATPGEDVDYTDADLLAPILEPGAVICIGLNYRSHILEMGRELPKSPTIFDKLPRALTPPYAELVIPKAGSARLDYEGELCVVIGSGGRHISKAHALAAVAGYTVLNDISMRDFQQRSMQWFAGKSWQETTPWGPALVTADEYGDFEGKTLTVSVNGTQRQSASIDDLVFGVADLVSDLSEIIELRPGDIIATGTPGGVAEAMDPQAYLLDGDVVEVSITGLGTLRNVIKVAS